MYRSFICCAVASAVALSSVARAASLSCAPTLTFADVHFSEMIPPSRERTWTATVSVDASRCKPNSSGHFEIVFTRLSEFGPDLDFHERYAWRSSSVLIAVKFAADEAVQRYRVENITSCVCLK